MYIYICTPINRLQSKQIYRSLALHWCTSTLRKQQFSVLVLTMAFILTELNQSLHSDPKKAIQYVEDKILQISFRGKAYPLRDSPAHAIVSLALESKLPQPTLATQETVDYEISQLSQDQKKQYDEGIACFMKIMKDALSLSSSGTNGEILISERFTYLEKPFNQIPEYTPVFNRRTNLSEFFYCILGYHVKTKQLRSATGCHDAFSHVETPIPPTQASRLGSAVVAPKLSVDAGESVVGGIAKALATGLLKALLGKIAALIFNEIFPLSIPSYFDEVYKEIEKIVNQELTQNTIDQVNGRMNGLIDWVKFTYTNAKTSQELSKQKLTDMLTPQESLIVVDLIGVLKNKAFAKAGICTFMIVAGMHLAILQELAFVDPNASPADSHWVRSIKDYAKDQAKFAKDTTEAIIKDRLAMIKSISSSNADKFHQTMDYYEWKDELTGESEGYADYHTGFKGSSDPDAKAKRDRSFANHKAEVEKQLIQKMNDPEATANEWLELVNKPLPQAPSGN